MRPQEHVAWRPNVLAPDQVDSLIELLERDLDHLLRVMESHLPGPGNSVSNYGEELPKVMHNRSAILNDPRTRATRAARDNGVLALMRSPSLKTLAEHLCGTPLGAEIGRQVIRYGPGDYVGPHHDGHPEQSNLRDGYVDLHLSLTTPSVASQTLIVQDDEHLRRVIEVGTRSGITVSRLPFWHQVTPLVAKVGRDDAIRWLLLVSFEAAS